MSAPSNNFRSGTKGIATSMTTRTEQMRAYDRLPKKVRDALKDTSIDFGCPTMARLIDQGYPADDLVLDVKASSDKAQRMIEAQYRRLAATLHPDNGGTTEAMAELNVAYEQAKEARRA